MTKKKHSDKNSSGAYRPTISNKKARFNYHLLETLEAGIALLGTEIKSLRQGKANLEESFCQIRDGELYLIGCTITPYTHGNFQNHNPKRPRKLLVHRRELHKLQTKVTQKGLTIIPLKIYFTRGLAKIEIAVGRGKTRGDKRDKLKERQVNREMKQAITRRQ